MVAELPRTRAMTLVMMDRFRRRHLRAPSGSRNTEEKRSHMLSHGHRLRRLGLTSLAIGLLVLAAGCGSSGSSDDDSSGSTQAAATTTAAAPAADAGIADAKKATDELLQRPTQIAVTAPIGQTVPKGKTVALLQCGFPACIPPGDHVRAAAKSLGWTVRTINTGLTPETVQAGWDQAVRIKPDGVIAIPSYTRETFAKQLEKLKAADIPVVNCCTPEDAGNGIQLTINALDNGKAIGQAMAKYVVGSREGKAHPVSVDVGGLPIAQVIDKAFKAEYTQLQPDAKIESLTVPVTSIGKDAPTRIVGFLRSHPDVDIIVLAESSPAIGLPAALKAAGLDVPIFAEGVSSTIYQYIRAGQMEGTVAFDDYGVGYTMVDGLVRLFTGGDIEDSNKVMPRWVLTKDNLPEGDTFPVVADNDAQFEKLWGVSG